MSDEKPTPDTPRDIRSHFVYRLSLYTTIAERNGKVYFHERFGVTLREYRILAVIGYSQPVSLMQLAQECYLDKGQVSRVVSKLVDEKLVAREKDTDPTARGGKLVLTETGQTLVNEALDYGDALNARAMSVLSPAEQQLFSEHLDRILAHARVMFEEAHDEDQAN